MLVLLTGATGFIGHALLVRLSREGGYILRAAVRNQGVSLPTGASPVVVGGLERDTDWSADDSAPGRSLSSASGINRPLRDAVYADMR